MRRAPMFSRLAMLTMGVVASIHFAACSASPEQSRDAAELLTAQSSESRWIVGGERISGLPAVGAITRYGAPHCTGTLVGPRKVLTAAHCVSGVSVSSLRFVVGSSIYSPDHVLQVSEVRAHPNYRGSDHDVGLLILTETAPLEPIPVISRMGSDWVGVSLLFVGYGITQGGTSQGSGYKRAVVMPVESVGPTSFSYGLPGKNTCNGDSGGPALALDEDGQWWVTGVTSYGDFYCEQYGVHMRADTALEFIGETWDPSATGCAGESYQGRCEDSTVVWCEEGSIRRRGCEAGKQCGWSNDHGYFGCIDAAIPCAGETFAGRCNQEGAVVWCEEDAIKSITCGDYGRSCGWDDRKSFYNCL